MGTRLIVAITIALCATAAVADQRIMEEADTNADGQISLSEFKAAHEARIEERFARVDANADGFITDDEMQAARENRREMMRERRHRGRMSPESVLERLDADNSGGVSLQEFAEKRFSPDQQSFVAADSDGNGELNAEELRALRKAHRRK